MVDYVKRLEKMHAEKEELMKTATSKLIEAAFVRCDTLKAKAESDEIGPEEQIEFITTLGKAEKELSVALDNFNTGNFDSAVLHIKEAMNIVNIPPIPRMSELYRKKLEGKNT